MAGFMKEMSARVLVFRIGSLGDTLVSVPALWVVRKLFPGAQLTLLTNSSKRGTMVGPESVLGLGHLVERYITYPDSFGLATSVPAFLKLWYELRQAEIDVVVYLAPSARPAMSILRDWLFFRTACGKMMIGFTDMRSRGRGDADSAGPREADLLLERLSRSGLSVPGPGQGFTSIGIGSEEEAGLQRWLVGKDDDCGRPWIGIGPGANMPAKRWPGDRYGYVVAKLVEQFHVWPVVLGGPEDHELGAKLMDQWGCGYNGAGELTVREAGAALKRCAIYLGNDTGTMHLAASVGTRCVGVFSSRSRSGLWYPYGSNHVIFETPIDCSGCELSVCEERQMKCIMSISKETVLEGCASLLGEVLPNLGARS